MRIKLLDNITGKWAVHWTIGWFIAGVIALSTGFWKFTQHTGLDWFYLGVSFIGLLCVVSLSFRKNILGNGLGLLANIGEIIVQFTSGAVGLMLTPAFNSTTHVAGLFYWSKHSDGDGQMIPQSANKLVWLVTIAFIVIGLFLFPYINQLMDQYQFLNIDNDQFYWINVAAFVVAITAQATMIMRYAFSWWLWIISNVIWLSVNLITGNYIFAIQTMVYQVNAIVGLYEWYRNEQDDSEILA
ncbi:nicotinamide riboside transporter PnuC [Psychrobacter sp. I-STPA6b]|uniref:nicotinamide riboside transporter PnuC n=1 Tax=Psychrobacter sp. I-STPA6b TaxID=2585718 RepID=UPI001D0C159D|nr:nicotinamide riboside transporter PnuC [Psychrobacter sp. I-STPA6b]